MCLAQGPQRSDAGESRTRYPSVSSQALYHWATALPLDIKSGLIWVQSVCKSYQQMTLVGKRERFQNSHAIYDLWTQIKQAVWSGSIVFGSTKEVSSVFYYVQQMY